jgi:hypothetical protein
MTEQNTNLAALSAARRRCLVGRPVSRAVALGYPRRAHRDEECRRVTTNPTIFASAVATVRAPERPEGRDRSPRSG